MLIEKTPADDEFELSLFGPGRGECAVLHIGAGDWIVVDSCIDPDSQEPVALRYLDALGVAIERQVRALVISHFDVDHVRGAARLFARAQAATVWVSNAEIAIAVLASQVDHRRRYIADAGFREYAELVELLMQRARPGQSPATVTPSRAIAGRTVFARNPEANSGTRVTSLSPSDSTVQVQIDDLRYLFEGAPRRTVGHRPNDRSVVLWVSAGCRHVLLGGDLERSSNPATGWIAAVQSHQDAALPGPAIAVKVPHHASENAHSSEMWDDLLIENSHALIAPFAGVLPRDQDVERIRSATANAYLCAPSTAPRSERRSAAVERTIREVTGGRLRRVRGRMGHVRVRCSMTDGAGEIQTHWTPPALRL